MLSRFSRLPVISSFFQNCHNYPTELIDSVVCELKGLGKRPPNQQAALMRVARILSLMRKYSDSLPVQRVCCHALSNLAMQVAVSRGIVERGGFRLIKKSLLRFEDDHKLCWLASSALWNLSRPPANRSVIGADGVELMFRTLAQHRGIEKVTNTTIGALSNLSLCESLKNLIAAPPHIETILSVLSEYAQRRSLCVMTSGAGLVNNLAVSDAHATAMVRKGAIGMLLQLLHWSGDGAPAAEDDTLHRNACSALNNLLDADDFLGAFLESSGVEAIFAFMRRNDRALFSNLLENCLLNVEVEAETTSLHLCALHGRLDILQRLAAQRESTPAQLDARDSKGRTCLDYAMRRGHRDVVEFLSRCGATSYDERTVTEAHDVMREAMQRGASELRSAREIHERAVQKVLPTFSRDICRLVLTFCNNIDMLVAIEKYR